MTNTIKRGEIYYADLSPAVGSEQDGVRPVLILQNDTGNKFSSTTIIAPITSVPKKRAQPTCLFIGCSLSDPNLRRLLDIPARVSESPRHFAIMKRKSIQYPPTLQESDKKLIKLYQNIDNNVREELFRTLGINVIWIDDYKEIPKILLELPRN